MKNFVSKLLKSQIKTAIETIQALLLTSNPLTNKQLIEICAEEGIKVIDSIGSKHLIHEVLETAVNLHLREINTLKILPRKDPFATLTLLENLTSKLPPQSWRAGEQNTLQQFSTPPALAFLMGRMLKPEVGKVALEPSAGTGSLALWLQMAGCRTIVNEISANRRILLELQGFQPHSVNAEFLNDLLPADIRPDYIMMNPPFSTSGRRTQKVDTNFGFRHVESALGRLNEGGRLVCLLGAKSCLQTSKGKAFWNRIGGEYKVHCFFIVPPKTFYKYGTNFQTVIVLIDKITGNENSQIQKENKSRIIEFESLIEILRFSEIFNKANI